VYPALGGELPGRSSDRWGEKSREREIETVYPDLGGELIDGLQTEGERRAEKDKYKQCILTWVQLLDGHQTEGERRAKKERYKQCILTWVESC
jgi:hypothetical protein